MRCLLRLLLAASLLAAAPGGAATVTNLRVIEPITCYFVQFSFDPPVPAPPADSRYRLYREDVLVDTTVSPTDLSLWDRTWLERGSVHSYRVRIVNAAGAEQEASAPYLHAQSECPFDSELQTLVLLYNFDDFEPQAPYTINYVRDWFFGAEDSLRAFIAQASYGRQTLGHENVIGYYRMPHPASYYCDSFIEGQGWYDCNTAQLRADAAQRVDPWIDFTGVDRVVAIFSGIGIVGSTFDFATDEGLIQGIRISAQTAADSISVPAHEFGHSLNGTQHARSVHCPGDVTASGGYPPDLYDDHSGGCVPVRYGDDYDVMAAGNLHHYNAFHKERLGYLSPNDVMTVVPKAAGTDVTLQRLESGMHGTKMVKIPLGNETYYFVEYRSNDEIDAVLVRLKIGTANDGDTLIAEDVYGVPYGYGPGTGAFVDRLRRVKVNVLAKNGQTAEVRIKKLSGCGIGFELALVIPILARLRRRVR